ncbi:MAG: dihydrodipicolinate synthase family protein [Victivallales bacterium]|nr:dihydrodipicolinate synthase family protein [Victivallales bacterium]
MSKKVISATITPLKADGSLDKAGLKNVLERNIRHGLDGVFLFGSMGEWGSFSNAFKEEAVELVSGWVNHRMEVLAGVNATSLPLTLEIMKSYRKYDFDAYVFMLPGKTSHLDPVKSVLAVLDAADRPVYLYYCPPNNNINFTLEQFETLMRHPNLKGIKNSSSNMWLRRELLLMRAEKGLKTLFFEGQEWAADEALIAGYDGMICGMGALCSKMMRKLADCVDRGDITGAVAAQNNLIRVFHGVYGLNIQNCWNGQKYALVKLGLIETPMTFAQEMSSLTEAAKARVEKCLEEFKTELD